MNIKKIIQRILGRHSTSKLGRRSDPRKGYTNELLMKIMHAVEHTQEFELSCDEVYALLDLYAESSIRGEDVTNLYPLVKSHLDGCVDCREEYEALLHILEASAASG